MKKQSHPRNQVLWIVVIVSLVLFATILIQHDNLRPLDLSANFFFQEWGFPYYNFFNFISFLGSIYWIPLMFVLFVGLLWKKKKHREAIILAVAVVSNYIIVNVIKLVTNWSRPTEVPLSLSGTFPSAHAATPFVLYILAYIFLVKKHRVLPFIGIVLLAIVIGVSRMVVNAHWLTDVLAGVLLAIAWISGTLLFSKK
ncbi:MAG: phosphatase PAP2 family protein [Candidatus Woesearchaeota archaeon]|nr:phosphatase PAP2 family protein [Candidatus Woesearchaeota archaeon]